MPTTYSTVRGQASGQMATDIDQLKSTVELLTTQLDSCRDRMEFALQQAQLRLGQQLQKQYLAEVDDFNAFVQRSALAVKAELERFAENDEATTMLAPLTHQLTEAVEWVKKERKRIPDEFRRFEEQVKANPVGTVDIPVMDKRPEVPDTWTAFYDPMLKRFPANVLSNFGYVNLLEMFMGFYNSMQKQTDGDSTPTLGASRAGQQAITAGNGPVDGQMNGMNNLDSPKHKPPPQQAAVKKPAPVVSGQVSNPVYGLQAPVTVFGQTPAPVYSQAPAPPAYAQVTGQTVASNKLVNTLASNLLSNQSPSDRQALIPSPTNSLVSNQSVAMSKSKAMLMKKLRDKFDRRTVSDVQMISYIDKAKNKLKANGQSGFTGMRLADIVDYVAMVVNDDLRQARAEQWVNTAGHRY